MVVLAFLAAALSSILVALVLGIVAAVVVFVFSSRRGRRASWTAVIVTGVVVAVIVFGAFAFGRAYTPVRHGTVAVVVRFGGLTGTHFLPGLAWRTPFIDGIEIISTVVQSYETSDNPDTSGADFRDWPVTAQTTDGQQILIKFTVLFRIPSENAADIVQNIGFVDAVVENVVKADSRNLARLHAQNYQAEDLYSGEGIFSYQSAVKAALSEQFAAHGVVLVDFLVRKVDFDEEYIRAIEQQQIAQEAIETAKYQADAAEHEKQRQIRLAEAEAERIKLTAAADAERQRLLADAEAYGIETRGAALQQYPELVQWEFVRNLVDIQWGILPSEGITPLVPLPSFEEGGTTPTIPSTP
jgi:regulator of protease activity HflC (stomatin/prohibitin superfamily)